MRASRPIRRLAAFVATMAMVTTGLGLVGVRCARRSVAGPGPGTDVRDHPQRVGHVQRSADEPLFVLIIGNDERRGVGGRRADALHVVGFNAARGEATIVNIPRDTVVTYPDGSQHRINEGNPRVRASG